MGRPARRRRRWDSRPARYSLIAPTECRPDHPPRTAGGCCRADTQQYRRKVFVARRRPGLERQRRAQGVARLSDAAATRALATVGGSDHSSTGDARGCESAPNPRGRGLLGSRGERDRVMREVPRACPRRMLLSSWRWRPDRATSHGTLAVPARRSTGAPRGYFRAARTSNMPRETLPASRDPWRIACDHAR